MSWAESSSWFTWLRPWRGGDDLLMTTFTYIILLPDSGAQLIDPCLFRRSCLHDQVVLHVENCQIIPGGSFCSTRKGGRTLISVSMIVSTELTLGSMLMVLQQGYSHFSIEFAPSSLSLLFSCDTTFAAVILFLQLWYYCGSCDTDIAALILLLQLSDFFAALILLSWLWYRLPLLLQLRYLSSWFYCMLLQNFWRCSCSSAIV
jgi:hypothetical protein